jgi:hypothetical protein
MSINQKMNSLGDIGAKNYDPSSDVLTQLVARTRRQRAWRQGTTAFAGSVGAIALALVTVQIVAAVEQDPAFQDRNFPDNVPIVEKIDKPAPPEPVDLDPIIEKLEAAAQEQADLEKKAAEEAAAKKAAEKKAAEEAAAKEAAEKEASEPKETTEPKEDTESCEEKYPYDKYEYKYYKCSKGQWFAKNGWLEYDGNYKPILKWNDAATGNEYWGAFFPGYGEYGTGKLWKTTTQDINWADAGYLYPKSWLSDSRTCANGQETFEEEGTTYTKIKSCWSGEWVVQP